MILGELCTRRCPFCNVAHGRPLPPNARRTRPPRRCDRGALTEVHRDHERRPGRFARRRRRALPGLHTRRSRTRAANAYRNSRPGLPRKTRCRARHARGRAAGRAQSQSEDPFRACTGRRVRGYDYSHSLELLKDFKARFPGIPTKSGLMVGLGETDEEIAQVMGDLREHGVDMLTIGQYLNLLPTICRCCAMWSLRYSRSARRSPTRSASRMRPADRSCVRATMPTARRTRRA